jgi:hypothetical protein
VTLQPKTIAKTITIFLMLIAAGFLGFYALANRAVSAGDYEQKILSSIKEQTGLDAKIDGNMRVAIFPMPRLVINGLEIGTDANLPPATPRFTIEKIEISVAPSSVFSDNIRLSSVVITRPILSLERAKDGNMHWGWLNSNLLKTLSTKNWGLTLPFSMSDGEIKYQDSFNNQNFTIDNIAMAGIFGKTLNLKGISKLNDQKISFSIDNKANNAPTNASDFPLNLAIYSNDKNHIKLESTIASNNNSTKIFGAIKAESDDVEKFLPEPKKKSDEKNQDTPKNSKPEKKSPLPISLNGKLLFENGAFHFSNLAIDGMNSKATGSADINWKNWYPTIAANLAFKTLDYPMWKQLLKNRIGEIKNAEKPKFGCTKL